MEIDQVFLAFPSVDVGIACWDLRTGEEKLRYRTCASSPHGLLCVARTFLTFSQLRASSSASIFVWVWDKPQFKVKSFPAKPIGPLVVVDSKGYYIIDGSSTGTIDLWERNTGIGSLLRSSAGIRFLKRRERWVLSSQRESNTACILMSGLIHYTMKMIIGQNPIFLDRIVQDHGGIDLEWLRDVPPQDAKDYLLDIKGLGLKSVECVRLLTLHQLAFPVDINVCRIIVRLGWVPIEPLPEMLQFHGLEMYPSLDTVQKYIWPRLCKLDQRTLYELHYHLITFGKVFCTKRSPNCRACPMQAECKHYASANARKLPQIMAPGENRVVKSTPIAFETNNTTAFNPLPFPLLTGPALSERNAFSEQNPAINWEPIVEEPKTPEHEPEPEGPLEELLQKDIEDAFNGDDPEEIPFIDLIPLDVWKYLEEHNMEFHDEISQALVALDPRAASDPIPKLKNKTRLRTEHLVYQLPDSHPLLENLEPRDADDPCPYCLAIWSPGETAESTEVPQYRCDTRDSGGLCDMITCVGCNSAREAQTQTVRGTIMIPVRTAMRGSFPLNGTYFQVNELFADHASSCDPIHVPRAWLGHLPRRTVMFGTSVTTLFKGLSYEEVQKCFYLGKKWLHWRLRISSPRATNMEFLNRGQEHS